MLHLNPPAGYALLTKNGARSIQQITLKISVEGIGGVEPTLAQLRESMRRPRANDFSLRGRHREDFQENQNWVPHSCAFCKGAVPKLADVSPTGKILCALASLFMQFFISRSRYCYRVGQLLPRK